MSRSVKKAPIVQGSGESKKKQKRITSHIVRRKMSDPEYDIGNGNAYKKVTESYNISDYTCRWTKEEAERFYLDQVKKGEQRIIKRYPTLEDWLNHWRISMLGK